MALICPELKAKVLQCRACQKRAMKSRKSNRWSLVLRPGGTGWRPLAAVLAAFFIVAPQLGGIAAAGTVGDPPIYNPASKSYFQLLTKPVTNSGVWTSIQKLALSNVFKGVRGRLAVVDSPETHEFIVQNFDLSREVWIGLRYWCDFRMLQWSDSRPYSPSDPGHFSAWHPQWYRNATTNCETWRSGEQAFMPVYYRPLGQMNARWQASGPAKGFERYLVEYPTGGE